MRQTSAIDEKTRGGGEETYKVVFHLFDGFIGDRESELLLCDGEIKPELSPSVVSILWVVRLQLFPAVSG